MWLCVFCHYWGDLFELLWVSVLFSWSKPKQKPSSKITFVQDSCRFDGKQAIYKAAHAQCRLGPMWFLWETMHLPLAIAMVTITHFSEEIDLCDSVNDRCS
jgi:hypothetical protein